MAYLSLHLAQVVNLDDPQANFFISQAHPQAPLLTYSLEDDRADVFALEVTLSLFETELLIRTPKVRSVGDFGLLWLAPAKILL